MWVNTTVVLYIYICTINIASITTREAPWSSG